MMWSLIAMFALLCTLCVLGCKFEALEKAESRIHTLESAVQESIELDCEVQRFLEKTFSRNAFLEKTSVETLLALQALRRVSFDWELRAVGAEAALKTVEGQRDEYRNRFDTAEEERRANRNREIAKSHGLIWTVGEGFIVDVDYAEHAEYSI